ncbi:MAG: phosphate signaling complex protein PhoU [Gammaproteobacteria bacterium]
MNQRLEGHIARRYDGELSHVHASVIELGGLALDQLTKTLEALSEREVSAALRVLERDESVKQLEKRLDDEIVRVIARRAPVAKDLRSVIGMAKAVAGLGHVERECVNVAQMALTFFDHGMSPPPNNMMRDVCSMGRTATSHLRTALEVFDACDLERAIDTLSLRQELSHEFQCCLRRLSTFLMEDARNVGQVVNVVLSTRSLERVGEYALDLCECVIYQVTGEDRENHAAQNASRESDAGG